MQYFGSKIVEGVAESSVEAEIRWVEVGGAGWRWMELGGGEWSWVEVDGAGWRWVHDLAIPKLKYVVYVSNKVKVNFLLVN